MPMLHIVTCIICSSVLVLAIGRFWRGRNRCTVIFPGSLTTPWMLSIYTMMLSVLLRSSMPSQSSSTTMIFASG